MFFLFAFGLFRFYVNLMLHLKWNWDENCLSRVYKCDFLLLLDNAHCSIAQTPHLSKMVCFESCVGNIWRTSVFAVNSPLKYKRYSCSKKSISSSISFISWWNTNMDTLLKSRWMICANKQRVYMHFKVKI